MGLQPCVPQPFVGTMQEGISFSTQISKLTRGFKIGIPTWSLNICVRPAIPMYGLAPTADGVFQFLPSTSTQSKTLLQIARSALQASKDSAIGTAAPTATYSGNPDYSNYLWNKIGDSVCKLQRYEEAYNKIYQFFANSGLIAFNIATYKELTYLTRKLQLECDMQMLLPPGIYTFDLGSLAHTALEAWFAADPTLNSLYSLEIVTS